MESVTSIRLGLSDKLRDPDYFNNFFDERTRDEIAEQIRELRDMRKLNQSEFADLAGMKQSAVSRIEQADYAGWTYKTLLRVASALGARIKIIFIRSEDVIEEYREREAQQRKAEAEIETGDLKLDRHNTRHFSKPENALTGRVNYGLRSTLGQHHDQPETNEAIKQLAGGVK